MEATDSLGGVPTDTKAQESTPCAESGQLSLKCHHPHTPPARFSPKGLSLIEILVALAFMAVFSAGMAGLAIGLVKANAQARSMDIAVYLAHDRLETIRNSSYASVTAANFPAQGYGEIVIGNPPVRFPDFQRTVTIQASTPTAGTKRVVVTVSWRGGRLSEEMIVGE